MSSIVAPCPTCGGACRLPPPESQRLCGILPEWVERDCIYCGQRGYWPIVAGHYGPGQVGAAPREGVLVMKVAL